MDMEKVVILARVSTEGQEYQRQINELTEYCQKMNWSVEKVFANKVSGAVRNEERTEICDLIEFVTHNKIRRVVCLEISRIGRNTLEALKIIYYIYLFINRCCSKSILLTRVKHCKLIRYINL